MDSVSPTFNLACALVGPKELQLQQRPIKCLGGEDVLVKVMSTGLCGSDAHIWERGSTSKQLILGHEAAGVIVAIGSEVKSRRVGQRVAIEPGRACLKCDFCLQGKSNHCEKLQYCGVEPTDGLLCQYFSCPAHMTIDIPNNVSWDEAAAIQPLAVAVHLAKQAGLHASQTLGVLVNFAKQCGADVGVISSPSHSNKDPWTYAKDTMSSLKEKYHLGLGMDVVVEASGAEPCTHMALALLKPGCTCVQAGLGKPLTSVPLAWLTAKELVIKGTARYTPGCFSEAIDLISSGRVDIKPFITAKYPLSNIKEAFTALSEQQGIKIIVQNQE
ncbi:hypothetical protein CLAIMM_09764 [Cladophialophora immunda]|nr:hypothetical protein CLAIMM_09764 [Cladophialophora immunda]